MIIGRQHRQHLCHCQLSHENVHLFLLKSMMVASVMCSPTILDLISGFACSWMSQLFPSSLLSLPDLLLSLPDLLAAKEPPGAYTTQLKTLE